MVELLGNIFTSQGFEPHGYCFLWTRPLLWLYIVSDSLITLSYYSISLSLIYFVRKRRDVAFNWIFLLFAGFIIACGTTHLMALWTLWSPLYWLDAAVKAITATASLLAAVALWPLVPKALALPSPSQLKATNLALQEEVLERNRAQEALRTARDELEIRVYERTKELAETTEAMREEIAQRKRVESQLHLQHSALESAANAIVITDREGRITWVNASFTRLTGYASEEVLGQNPRLLNSGKQDRPFYQHLWETILSGQVWQGEIVNRRKDGTLYVEDQTITPVRDIQGDITHFIAIKQDITKRKHAEKALQESEMRYRELVENANDIIYTHDLAGNFTSLNRAGERITGYTRDEALAMNLSQAIAPEHLDLAREMVARKLGESGPTTYELEVIAKDGRRVPLEVSTRLIYQDGTAIGVEGIGRDITERRRAEATRQALYRASLQIQEPQALRERLDRLLETVHEILQLDRVNILLSDPEERWLQAVAYLGVEEPLELVRIPIGPEGGALAHAFRTKEAVIWDGLHPVPASLRLQPPFDRIKALRSRAFIAVPLIVQGRSIGVLAADRRQSHQPLDTATQEMLQMFVTQAALAIEQARLYETQRTVALQLEARVDERTRELRDAMILLEEASKHKSEFLANMSHELRTPLNSILGFSDLLRDPKVGSLAEKQARYVHNIRESGRHLLTLINDLLDLSKVEAGRIELRPQIFNLREAIEAALIEIRPQSNAKALGLRLHVDDSLSLLTADPVRFKQILLNLLSNAIKFTPQGGRITVAARQGSREEGLGSSQDTDPDAKPSTLPPGDFVEISVQDTGIGMKPEDLPKLFQPFSQLEGSFTKQHHGTGLGLALTKRLVELHGGTVRADSEGEGRGSTFTVRLPLVAIP